MSAARAALLLLNGDIPEPALVRRFARGCRGVICADGGARHLAPLRLRADFVVGDMDSVPHPLPRDPRTVYWCDFGEDRSDFEKALAFAKDLGCARVYAAGALGGRVDHALVNLGVVERWAGVLEVVVLDRGAARLLGPGRYRLPRGRFSLSARPRAVVTIEGARYPLRRSELVLGSRGLGNAAGARASLTVHEGRVWLACDRPPAGW